MGEKAVVIFTAASCLNNQHYYNAGGYGAIKLYKDKKKEIYGGKKCTSNAEMELTAIVEALKGIKTTHIPIRVYSSSSFIINSINQKWYKKWEKDGWKNGGKKPVKNKELWIELLSLKKTFKDISFHKSSKSTHYAQEFAYELSVIGAEMNDWKYKY